VLTNNFGVQKRCVCQKSFIQKPGMQTIHPDDFEKKVLSKFELLHQNKELNSETEHVEIVQEGDFKYLRYLKQF